MQLSKLETQAYEILRNNNLTVFQLKDLSLLLNISRTKSYNLIKALKKKDTIKKVSGSKYSFTDINEYIIACNAHFPSYISFWTAFSYYHWSDQLPKTIYLCTTKYTKNVSNLHYVTIAKKKFFGYTQIGEIIIAEKEKAIVDSLLLPKYAGGIEEIRRCIKASLSQLDINKLIQYALQMQSIAVIRRLGLLMERNLSKSQLKQIKQHIGVGYELLDPSLSKKNNFNKQWLLDVNL